MIFLIGVIPKFLVRHILGVESEERGREGEGVVKGMRDFDFQINSPVR